MWHRVTASSVASCFTQRKRQSVGGRQSVFHVSDPPFPFPFRYSPVTHYFSRNVTSLRHTFPFVNAPIFGFALAFLSAWDALPQGICSVSSLTCLKFFYHLYYEAYADLFYTVMCPPTRTPNDPPNPSYPASSFTTALFTYLLTY